MPFEVVSGVGRGMGVLDGGGHRRRERAVLWGECVTFHCNQRGFCCIFVQERRALPKLLWETYFISAWFMHAADRCNIIVTDDDIHCTDSVSCCCGALYCRLGFGGNASRSTTSATTE